MCWWQITCDYYPQSAFVQPKHIRFGTKSYSSVTHKDISHRHFPIAQKEFTCKKKRIEAKGAVWFLASHLFLNVTHIKSSFSKKRRKYQHCHSWVYYMGTAGIYFYFLLLYRRFKLKEISLFDITNHMYVTTI